VSSVSNRLWHTDASFVDPPGRYSMLSAPGDSASARRHEFADMRAAWDALDVDTRAQIDGLHAHHSIAYSRQVLASSRRCRARQARRSRPAAGADDPRSGRRALYLASHASRIVEWPLPRPAAAARPDRARDPAGVRLRPPLARRRLRDLDNRATMHRARPFDDRIHRRELRRTTTLDIA